MYLIVKSIFWKQLQQDRLRHFCRQSAALHCVRQRFFNNFSMAENAKECEKRGNWRWRGRWRGRGRGTEEDSYEDGDSVALLAAWLPLYVGGMQLNLRATPRKITAKWQRGSEAETTPGTWQTPKMKWRAAKCTSPWGLFLFKTNRIWYNPLTNSYH